MKIAPLKVSDPWYGRIMDEGKVESTTLRHVPIESTVEMEMVELLHGGPEENYRPYLHLRGELTEAVPSVELPYGVTELALRRGSGLAVDAFYDFSPRQLGDLVDKGYFTADFRVPDEMTGIAWDIPGSADFTVVAPEFADQPPLVFMSVHEQSGMALDQENSGYDLSAYFPDYVPATPEQIEAAQEAEAPEYGGSGLDVFSDVVFDEHRPVQEAAFRPGVPEQEQRAPVPSGIFERLMSEIDARRAPAPEVVEEPEVPEAEPIVPGSPEDLYLSRVSPGVDQVLSGEQDGDEDPFGEAEQAQGVNDDATDAHEDQDLGIAVAEDGFLDLSEPDPDLVPLGVQTGIGEEDPEAHRKAAERRTARIRSELGEDDEASNGTEAQPGM